MAEKKRKDRNDDLSRDPDIIEQATKLFDMASKAFDDQRERADRLMDYWDTYDCQLGRFQNYSGMSKIFVPIIRNAIDALETRFINQCFPNSGRHVECVTDEDDQPFALLSLIEHYVAESKLRTQAARELLRNGQVEGQYNAYFYWKKTHRTVITKTEQPIVVDGVEAPEAGTISVTMEEELSEACPMIEVLHDTDVAIIPQTAASVDEALDSGGCVTVIRRWTEEQIDQMVADGDLDSEAAENLIDQIGQASTDRTRDADKKLAQSIGVNVSRSKKYVVALEVWHKFEMEDGERRLCRAFFTDNKAVAGVKRNPNWNDRCPLHSAPVKKLPGVFKGESPIMAVQDMQYLANDMINEGADMMYYTLAPIIAADPQKVSKWKELVADIGAVWPVDPDGIKLFEYPNKVREALEVVANCKTAIMEGLNVNPAMMPQQTGKPGTKRNQAEIAMEQQVDILQTSDAVTTFEEEILTPFVQWAAETDHQFRAEEILVREYGDLGVKANMEQIPPIQWGKRWQVKWVGVEAQRNAANVQQMIAAINVVKELPPDALPGRRLDLVPAVDYMLGVVMGPTLARKVWLNAWENQSNPPEQENELLAQGFEVITNPADDDMAHIRVHMQVPTPTARMHVNMHQAAMKMKQQAAMMQAAQAQGIAPPQAQKPSRGRRTAQGSRPGAQPAGPRQNFSPPGMIRPDALPRAGALVPPRKAS